MELLRFYKARPVIKFPQLILIKEAGRTLGVIASMWNVVWRKGSNKLAEPVGLEPEVRLLY